MARESKSFDVWLVSANTVYRGVPLSVVTDWAQQGRLGANDKVKPAGPDSNWTLVSRLPIVSDFLFVKKADGAPVLEGKYQEELEPLDMDVGWGRKLGEEEDDVDMIPLIDVSLVLLIFFMMTATVSALSPIDVPAMKNAAELRGDPDAMTVHIDKNSRDEMYYALRVGEKNPEKIDDQLNSLGELVGRLNVRLNEGLAAGKRPPEVRIACHKDLPSERVHDLARELQRLKDAQKISFYGAEINERSK